MRPRQTKNTSQISSYRQLTGNFPQFFRPRQMPASTDTGSLPAITLTATDASLQTLTGNFSPVLLASGVLAHHFFWSSPPKWH